MNNLYQEAQRDDWHGQIVPKEVVFKLRLKDPVQNVDSSLRALDTLQAILNTPESIAEVNRQMNNLLIYGTTHPEAYIKEHNSMYEFFDGEKWPDEVLRNKGK